MKEIELKILEIDSKDFLRRLKKNRAKKIFSGLLESIYFDTSKRMLLKNSQVLRLRKLNKKAFLTFKKKLPLKKSISSEETEFEIDDFNRWKKFLEGLGFEPVLQYKKKRVSYRFGNVRVELDQFLGKFRKIPLYAELEAHSEKELLLALKQLGFSKKDAKKWHSGQLFSHYGFNIR